MSNKKINTNDPAKTYTLEDFIALGEQDNLTYFNYSIIEKYGDHFFITDHSLIDDYLPELVALCDTVTLNDEEYKKYRYCPDLLAYDVYESTQLDFIIMAANDIVDPKEFTLRSIKLPVKSYLKMLLTDIAESNKGYIDQNRIDNGIEL